jgi:ankyrin repeat protein
VNIAGDNYGATLQTASRRGHLSVVQLLLDHNADVDAQTSQYGTALEAALEREHETVAQILRDAGAI